MSFIDRSLYSLFVQVCPDWVYLIKDVPGECGAFLQRHPLYSRLIALIQSVVGWFVRKEIYLLIDLSCVYAATRDDF